VAGWLVGRLAVQDSTCVSYHVRAMVDASIRKHLLFLTGMPVLGMVLVNKSFMERAF